MSKSAKFVLIAEDDKAYASVYEAKLTKEGFDVIVAGNGEIALVEARKRKPDVILLDLMMPVKDGYQTLHELKADPKLKDIPVVVASNLSQDVDVDKVKNAGAEEYFIKSDTSITDMVAMVRKYSAGDY